MSDYTHINLKEDVDDQAPNFGLVAAPRDPDGARPARDGERRASATIRIAPGYRIPFAHKHKNQEEVYVLVNGSARIKLEDEVRDMKQWDAVRVHRDTVRGFEAGDDGAEFIAIGAPNTGPGDAEMIQDWWSD